MEISCAFATAMDTPEHVAIAEELGYRRAWLYDSPALYPDAWVQLARAADRTSRIGLGPGVAIPSLRHPMTTAAAIATLAELAPGRVEVAIGSGFTGRMTFGQKPLPWAFVREYVSTLQALLRGEAAPWEGRLIQMMHPPGFGAARPLDVPIIIGAGGPKGAQAAVDLGAAGVFVTGPRAGITDRGLPRAVVLSYGTVLGEGEDAGSERVLAAAGHGGAVALHGMYERGGDVTRYPGGAEWLAELEKVPAETRHIALHDLHLVGLNDRDRLVVDGELLQRFGQVRTPAGWRDRLAELEAAGITEIAYQPAGPDIPGELARFMAAARG
ncbi:MAG: LLM class flavin-dependent oxidoreductase [Dehalococcoidia bacterium]|nr:LLM class flavin-dependent oxidoreductase [Dehalococcoidia bacterium]